MRGRTDAQSVEAGIGWNQAATPPHMPLVLQCSLIVAMTVALVSHRYVRFARMLSATLGTDVLCEKLFVARAALRVKKVHSIPSCSDNHLWVLSKIRVRKASGVFL